MNAEHDPKHATKDGHGNITANDQNGLDVKGKPIIKPDSWRFGDDLFADRVTPIKQT